LAIGRSLYSSCSRESEYTPKEKKREKEKNRAHQRHWFSIRISARISWMIKKAFNGNLVCAIFKYTLTQDSIQSPLGEIGSINAQDIILTLLISSIIDLLEER
jgi:hypothetical protein